MLKRLFIYLILLSIYIFIPGISQQIFMTYDDYWFYIISTFLFIINALFAFIFLKFPNKLYNFIAAFFITSIGILSVIIVMNLNLGWKTIEISLFSNAISSILAWEIAFQIKQKKMSTKNNL
jgi:lysylphosphatidylglycerol synthetase-like protein (DUF2156 family)